MANSSVSPVSANQVCFRTDDAWDFIPDGEGHCLHMPVVDVREEAKGLRFITSKRKVDAFAEKHAADFRPFTLFGSGDFHHLSAVWTRQFTEPFTLLSFDNHPDWDVRPPRWSCGAWINRALENSRVDSVAIWGCNNFECTWPWRLLGNRHAAKTHKLLVFPWRQKKVRYPGYFNPLRIGNWKTIFADWLDHHHDHKVYVTIDMDCLFHAEAVTNWESGRFHCHDIVWALQALREKAGIIGGDICGAWSDPRYETSFQRLAGWFDHPTVEWNPGDKVPPKSGPKTVPKTTLRTGDDGKFVTEKVEMLTEYEHFRDCSSRRNLKALKCLWPALTGQS